MRQILTFLFILFSALADNVLNAQTATATFVVFKNQVATPISYNYNCVGAASGNGIVTSSEIGVVNTIITVVGGGVTTSFTYTPPTGFTGLDVLNYSDGTCTGTLNVLVVEDRELTTYPGTPVSFSLPSAAGIVYKWYNLPNVGVVYNGLPGYIFSTDGDQVTVPSTVTTYHIEVEYNNGAVVAPRRFMLSVKTDASLNCTGSSTPHNWVSCNNGASLVFRDDFRGVETTDAAIGSALPIGRTSYLSSANATIASGQYALLKTDAGVASDHTYPNNALRGYFMKVGLSTTNPSLIYQRAVPNSSRTCLNSMLYVSVWLRNVSTNKATVNLVLEDQAGTSIKAMQITNIPNSQWQQYGFEVPSFLAAVTALYVKIENVSNLPCELAIDDIDIQHCTGPNTAVVLQVNPICGSITAIDKIEVTYDNNNMDGRYRYYWESSMTGDVLDTWTYIPPTLLFALAPTPSLAISSGVKYYRLVAFMPADPNVLIYSNIYEVVVNPLPSPTVISPTPFCPGMTLTATSTRPTIGDTYQWTGDIISTDKNIPLNAGTYSYSLTVKDSVGCQATTSGSITVNSNPTWVTAPATAQSACAGKILTLNGTITNPASPTNYLWTDPSAGTTTAPTLALSPVVAGNYTIKATDINGCSISETIGVTIDALPAVAITSTPVCFGSTVTLTASGATSYQWNGGLGGLGANLGTGATVTQAITTPNPVTYTLTGTDAKGCVNTATHSVTALALPSGSITTTALPQFCDGTTIDLNGPTTPGLLYLWNNANAATTPSITLSNADIAAGASANYTLTLTDANGCSSTTTPKTVRNLGKPAVSVTALPSSVCEGSNARLTAVSPTATSFAWSGATTGTGGQFKVTPSASSPLYTVSVTDANGCTNSAPYSFVVNPLPNVVINAPTAICLGETADLKAVSPDPGLTYLWTGGFTTAILAGQKPLNTKQYHLTVTNANNCVTKLSETIIVNPLPIVSINAPVTKFCDGDKATLTAVGAGNYLWSTGENTNSIEVNSTGNYTLTVSDANACEKTSSVAITKLPLPAVSITADGAICDGSSTRLTAVAPTATSFLWDNGVQNSTINTVASANKSTFTVNVSDGKCTATTFHTFQINPLPNIQIIAPNEVCFKEQVKLEATGATTYKWLAYNNNTNTLTHQPQKDTKYVVEGIDSKGCINTQTHPLTVKPLPTVSIQGPSAVCEGESVILQGNSNGSYSWDTGETSTGISFMANASKNYQLTANLAGCESKTSHSLIVNASPTIAIKGKSAICEGTAVQLSVVGDSLVDYQWQLNTQSKKGIVVNFTPVQTATHWVKAKNNKGCEGKASHLLVVNKALEMAIVGDTTVCEGGKIHLEAYGAERYQWGKNIADSGSVYEAQARKSLLKVRGVDRNGCTAEQSVNIEVMPRPKADFTVSPTTINQKYAEVEFNSANDQMDLFWDLGNGFTDTRAEFKETFDVSEVGKIYEVVQQVTNEYGCVDSVRKNITVELYVPNTFTPNGDGVHDLFMDNCNECESIKIFDRWGVVLYEGAEGWDGNYKGKEMGNDTYFYTIQTRSKADKSGYITLLKKK